MLTSVEVVNEGLELLREMGKEKDADNIESLRDTIDPDDLAQSEILRGLQLGYIGLLLSSWEGLDYAMRMLDEGEEGKATAFSARVMRYHKQAWEILGDYEEQT